MTIIDEFQRWYLGQCDGDWEHQYGIKIQTIDNPGWRISIDLAETPLSERAFPETQFQGEVGDDWYVCKVIDKKFEGACGPARLDRVISIFLDWAYK